MLKIGSSMSLFSWWLPYRLLYWRLWLLCQRRKQLMGWRLYCPKLTNGHRAVGLRLAILLIIIIIIWHSCAFYFRWHLFEDGWYLTAVMLHVFQNFLLRVASHSILSRDTLFRGFLKDVCSVAFLRCDIAFTFVTRGSVKVRILEFWRWAVARRLD